MKVKMGYIVIAIGIAVVLWGIMLLTKQKTIEKPLTNADKPKFEQNIKTTVKYHIFMKTNTFGNGKNNMMAVIETAVSKQ